MKGHFILLREQLAEKRDRSLLSRGKSDQTQVLEGSLWHLSKSDSLEKLRGKTITLHSHDYDGVVLETDPSNVEKLDEREFHLLYALNNCRERFRLFLDKQWLAEASHFAEGAYVYVVNVNELPERVPAKIQYVGELMSRTGTWFGVELSPVSCIDLSPR